MPDVFDPYYTWLGIPKKEQPPNHYRLLAISLYESDGDVIANAADRIMAHLRTYQTSRNGHASQKLLREVALARVCLLTPQMKARYDRELQAKLAAPPPSLSDSGGSVLDDDFPPKRSGSALGGTSGGAGASSRKTSSSNPAISASGSAKPRVPGEGLAAAENIPGAGRSGVRRGQPSDTDSIRSTPIEPLAGIQVNPGKSAVGRSGNPTPSAGSPAPAASKKKKGGATYIIVAAVALGALLLGGVPVVLMLGQRDNTPVAKGNEETKTKDTSGSDSETTPPIDAPPQITKVKPPDPVNPSTTPTTTPPATPEIPTTAHQFTPPSVTPGQWHDMLPIVDVKLDKLWGDWTIVSGALEASPPPGWMEKNAPRNANLVLPVAPQGEYQLRLKLQFTEGDQVAIISLPVEKRQAMFSIRGKTGERTKAGFEKLGNKRIDENSSRTTIIQPRLGTVHQLDLIVIPHGGIAQLYALWDGKPASHWTGPLDQIAPIEEFAVPGDPSIGLATSGTVARFPAVYLGVISGNLRHFRELGQLLLASGSPDENPAGTNPTATNPSFTPPTGTNPPLATLPPEGIDLLKLADGTKYAVKGAWKMNGGALECSQSSGGALLEIPVHPPEHYRVELVAERTAGNDGFGLALVSKFTQFAVAIDAQGGKKAVISKIDGIGGVPENPSMVESSIFEPGRVVRLRYEVHPGRIRVLADDKPVIDWKGDFSRLSIDSAYYTHRDRSALAISSRNSVYRIYEARLLPLDAPGVASGPDAAAVAAALPAVQQQFAAEYEAAKKPEQKVTLAQSLLEEARQKSAEPAVQVALWDEARRLAVEGGDYQLAIATLQARNARYPLNFLEEAAKLLEPISLPAAKRAENLAIATLASDLLEQAIEKDQLDTALKLGLAAQNAIKKLADRELTKTITDRLSDARAMQAEAAKIADSLAAVAGGTAAPADALVVGRYQCFVKNDWAAGLPNLAAGSDPKLQDLAKKDLAGAKTVATRMLIADQWYELAAKLPRDDRKPLLRHAAEWYIQALPTLTGTQRTTAVSRVHEAALTRPTTAPTVLAQGLVACWSFDEGRGGMAQDSVGKNHAYVNRATWTQGVSGGALSFDAPDQYALVPSGAAFPAWTISMWVRQSRAPTREGGLFMTQSLRTGHVHFFLHGDSVIDAKVEDFIGGAGGNLPMNEWHHLAATQSGGRVTVFMDGSEKGQGNAAGNAPRVPGIIGPARIGSWYDDDPSRSFHGSIDEVRIYNRVLADQEILLLAQPPQ